MLTKALFLLVAMSSVCLAQQVLYQLPTVVQPARRPPVNLRYTGGGSRAVLSYQPTQVLIPGTLRSPYAAATPTGGVVVGNYYQPAVQAYQQQTARLQYEPVESHGYHIGFR